jgi:Spy/CpxP family protein refolding chaperone
MRTPLTAVAAAALIASLASPAVAASNREAGSPSSNDCRNGRRRDNNGHQDQREQRLL